jgi:methyl-accepting chemotaxis protein
MQFHNFSIKTKLLIAFSLIASLVGLIGWNGYISTIKIEKTSTVIGAAKEMQLAVRGDMQMIMEFLACEDTAALEEIWKEHLNFIGSFDLFQQGIASGTETPLGTIYPSDDEGVQDALKKSDALHNDQFVPGIKQIYTMKKELITSGNNDPIMVKALHETDKKVDATGAELITLLGNVDKLAKEEMESVVKDEGIRTLIGTLAAAFLAIGGGLFLAIKITGPLSEAVDFAGQMSNGDLTGKLTVRQQDETGILAEALNKMNTDLGRIFKEILSLVQTLASSATELSTIANQMSTNSQQTSSKANTVAVAAEEMSANMSSVAAATEETSVNVNMVASAAEEMSSTIAEISSNTETTQAITQTAVSQSEHASIQINELGAAAQEIGKVTETITEISEQTNLLALNATIEAARAGEAGKGFAVVANEIKDLAKQTSEATNQIKSKIMGIQTASNGSVTEIAQISTIIQTINEKISIVALTVEEQSSATQEIATNVSQASVGIQEVNENVAQASAVTNEIAADITLVGEASNEVSNNSSQVHTCAEQLTELADQLSAMVNQFKV